MGIVAATVVDAQTGRPVEARQGWSDGRREGTLSARVEVAPSTGDGWLAAG